MPHTPTAVMAAKNNILFFIKSSAAVAVLLMAPVAQAVVIDGSITRTGGAAIGTDSPWHITGLSNSVQTTVDLHRFNVNSSGMVTIDTLSWEGNKTTPGSASLSPNDTNGDGEIAFFDVMIRLYSASTNALIAFNDDSASTFGDGSIFDRDAFLSLSLNVGSYFLAVGSYDFSDTDALTGPAFGTGPMTWNGSKYVVNDHGDYRLTITGDVNLVSEPATLAILSLGLAAIGYTRRRKATQAPNNADSR